MIEYMGGFNDEFEEANRKTSMYMDFLIRPMIMFILRLSGTYPTINYVVGILGGYRKSTSTGNCVVSTRNRQPRDAYRKS